MNSLDLILKSKVCFQLIQPLKPRFVHSCKQKHCRLRLLTQFVRPFTRCISVHLVTHNSELTGSSRRKTQTCTTKTKCCESNPLELEQNKTILNILVRYANRLEAQRSDCGRFLVQVSCNYYLENLFCTYFLTLNMPFCILGMKHGDFHTQEYVKGTFFQK